MVVVVVVVLVVVVAVVVAVVESLSRVSNKGCRQPVNMTY